MRVFIVASLLSVVVLLAILSRAMTRRATTPPQIVLRVANWGSPAVESSFMTIEREIREEFERQHPGVRVQFEQIPGFGQYAPKLLMMHVNGSVPDVVSLDASSAAVFINNGVVRDLAPLVAGDPNFRLADFFDKVVQIYCRDERVYSIPLDFTPMMMYYNRRLFEAAGVPLPQRGWTWGEFLQAAQRLTIPADEPGAPPRQYGMYFMNVMPFWVPWLWTNGGDVLNATGRQATGSFDGPRSVAAMQFLTDLMLQHHVAPTIDEGKAAGVDLFRSGRAAMDVKGHWMMIDYRAEGLDFGVVELPSNTGQPTTVIYATGLSIMTKSPHADLAWEYIKFMTSRDVQVRRVSSGLAISGNRAAAAHYAGTPVEDAFIAAVEYARAPWGATVERYPVVEALGEEMMEDLLRSRAALGVAPELQHAAKLIDAALAEP